MLATFVAPHESSSSTILRSPEDHRSKRGASAARRPSPTVFQASGAAALLTCGARLTGPGAWLSLGKERDRPVRTGNGSCRTIRSLPRFEEDLDGDYDDAGGGDPAQGVPGRAGDAGARVTRLR